MPYKTGKLKGELTTPEIRKLIRAHNVLVSIKIPTGTKRDGLIKLIEDKGYNVNHKAQKIVDAKKDRPRRPTVTLEKAKELTKPKTLTDEQKKKKQQAKQKKAGEKAFLKKAIPAPPKPSKPSKGIKVGKPPPKPKMKKEDDVRPAKVAAPPIPKAKDFVKIGVKPKGQRIDTNAPRNVGTTKPKKTKEEKEANKKKNDEIQKRRNDLKRVKNLKDLQSAIEEFNSSEALQKKAEGKPLKKPLRIQDRDKDELIRTIVAYNIDKVVNIEIPAPTQRRTMTEAEKQAKALRIRQEKAKDKFYMKLTTNVAKLYKKYNKLLRDNKFQDVKGLNKKMQSEFDEIVEDFEEEKQADDEDFEIDDNLYNELENRVDEFKKQLKEIAEKGLKGKFTEEFKKGEKDKRKKEQGITESKKEEPKIDKKQIAKLSLEYIKEIKKMSPLKTLAEIKSTFKKYEKKIYDFIGTNVDNYEELREYWDDNWLDKISEAIPDGRKKEEPKKKSKSEKSPPPLRFSGSKSKIDKIKSKVKKSKISVEEGLKEWKIDIEAYESRRKASEKSLINKGYKSGGVDELKALEKEGIKIIKNAKK